MNIIQRCYEVLFSQHSLALFDLPFVLEAPIFVVKTLQQCHQTVISLPSDVSRKVKVRGRRCATSLVALYKWCLSPARPSAL